MSRKIRVHYPWNKTPVKGGFFVPSLNLEQTKEDGLRAAVFNKMKAKVTFVVHNGRLGVLFTRVR